MAEVRALFVMMLLCHAVCALFVTLQGRSPFVEGRLVIQCGNGMRVTLPAIAGLRDHRA